jgi:molybdate-binding protein
MGRLTPSVATALQLARILDTQVETLFGDSSQAEEATDAIWAWAPEAEACRFLAAEVNGRQINYPLNGQAHSAHFHDGVWRAGKQTSGKTVGQNPTLTMASCDPASALMEKAYARESGYRLAAFAFNGMEALKLLKQGIVHIAGLHRSNREHPERNAATVRSVLGEGYCLLRATDWDQGIAFVPGRGLASVASVLERSQVWAMREPGSAARDWLDVIYSEMGHPPAGREVHSHRAVAESIRDGWADAGVCVKLSAKTVALAFLSLQQESLDLVFHQALLEDPRIRALIRLFQSSQYRQILAELPGYDSRETGTLSVN